MSLFKYCLICGLCFFPGSLWIEYDNNALSRLALFWGGMVYCSIVRSRG